MTYVAQPKNGRSSEGCIIVTEPLGYVQFKNFVCGARVVITDSCGVQEESAYLGIPCLTLRENTAMPITVTERPNRLLKTDLYAQVDEVLAAHWRVERGPALWDGQGAKRCAGTLRTRLGI